MNADLEVREGWQTTLSVENHERDLSSTTVNVWLIDSFTRSHKVASSIGEPPNTKMTFVADFSDVEPGVYRLEVAPDGGSIIYPQDAEQTIVVVYDAHFDTF